MSCILRRMCGVAVCVLVFLAVSPTHAAPSASFPILEHPGWQWNPVPSGNYVVWWDERANGPPYPSKEEKAGVAEAGHVYGYDLVADAEFPIYTGPNTVSYPQIYGLTVVWREHIGGARPILGFDLSTSQPLVIYNEPGFRNRLRIHGSMVVWEERDTSNWSQERWWIYGKNLLTGDLFNLTPGDGNRRNPALDGTRAVWQDFRNGNWDIYGYDLTAGKEFLVSAKAGVNQTAPRISGDWVVWMEGDRGSGQSVYARNLLTGEEIAVSDGPGREARWPEIDGDFIVWRENRLADDTLCDWESNLFLFDLSTRTEIPLDTSTYWKTYPRRSGDLVVWRQKNSEGTYDIWGAYAPEPASFVLVALGGLGLALGRKRRRLTG